ncbi:MAG: anthranilate synthase component I family protein [Flavobacteriales bacterium]
MRIALRIPHDRPFTATGLRDESTFLFRRVSDQGRAVLGVGALEWLEEPRFTEAGQVADWTFGHLTYEMKNHLEPLKSRHPDRFGFPEQRWFVPRWVVEWKGEEAWLHVLPGDETAGLAFLDRMLTPASSKPFAAPGHWTTYTSREQYLGHAETLLRHIHRGDIYEVNYCIERTCGLRGWDPFAGFDRLLRNTQAPFAGFYRLDSRFALCASPERFLAFDGTRAVGQPMKGTRPRAADPLEDERLRAELASDAKERSENIMALDVMRHDLSRVAAGRSVHVEELCAVHSFPQVHQMVSTVSARIRAGHTPFDVVRAAFPMASMTGAPKFRAMQLIDEVEDQARGLYSGTLGFFAPDGTADLNVVIRTVLYDEASGMASLSTGSALTAACDPEQEWEECELKARSITNALAHA